MTKPKTADETLLNFIDQNRVTIGIILIIFIVAGVLVFSWQNRFVQTDSMGFSENNEVESLREQNKLLRQELEALKNQSVVAKVSGQTSTQKTKPQTSTPASQNRMININTASQSQLESLPKIGPVTAAKIINYRSQNGSFKSIEEIKNVSGIGEKIFELIKDKITVQ